MVHWVEWELSHCMALTLHTDKDSSLFIKQTNNNSNTVTELKGWFAATSQHWPTWLCHLNLIPICFCMYMLAHTHAQRDEHQGFYHHVHTVRLKWMVRKKSILLVASKMLSYTRSSSICFVWSSVVAHKMSKDSCIYWPKVWKKQKNSYIWHFMNVDKKLT